ncbi:MAG: EamA family transporter, partial [Burkholderiaceae bacterium]
FIFAVIDWWLSLDAWTYKLEWGPTLIAALVYVAIFPGIVAFRAWGLAVQRVGPSFAGVVVNLTPLLAALFSAVFLNENPELYHGLAFLLIVIGIAVFQRAR